MLRGAVYERRRVLPKCPLTLALLELPLKYLDAQGHPYAQQVDIARPSS